MRTKDIGRRDPSRRAVLGILGAAGIATLVGCGQASRPRSTGGSGTGGGGTGGGTGGGGGGGGTGGGDGGVDGGGGAFARPRVAALDYSGDTSAARQAILSRFPFIILGWTPSSLASPTKKPAILAMMDGIVATSPGTVFAQYVDLNELHDPLTPSDDQYPYWQQVNTNAWWALSQPGATKTQWTSLYGNYEINMTAATRPDAMGRRVPQAKADYDQAKIFSQLGGRCAWIFVDNMFNEPRVTADYDVTGTGNQTPAAAAPAFRAGYAAYIAALQAGVPGAKIIGNVECDTSAGYTSPSAKPELAGKVNGGFMEGAIGSSYSLDTWIGNGDGSGYVPTMEWYRSTIASTVDGLAVFNVYSDTSSAQALQVSRYGLATAMMDDGRYCLVSPTSSAPPWMDEFDQPIGTPIDPPQAAAWSSGVWRRLYQNGMVLSNPTTTAQTVTIPSGYRRFSGTQDPLTNSGAAVSGSITVPAKDGILLLKA